MPSTGKSFTAGISYYAGNPANAGLSAFDVPKGTLVIDTTNGLLYQKILALGTNTSGYALVLSGATGQAITLPTITAGLTASGSISNDFSGSTGTFKTSTGISTISGGLAGSVQALAAAGAVNLTTLITTIASAGAIALTLADGSNGQIKIISMITDGGDATLTPSNLQGGTTAVFGDIGDTLTLLFVGTKWAIIGNTGVTVS